MVFFSKPSSCVGFCKFKKRDIRGKHPAQQVTERKPVSKRYYSLHLPKEAAGMPMIIISQRNILNSSYIIIKVLGFYMFVEPGFIKFAYLI